MLTENSVGERGACVQSGDLLFQRPSIIATHYTFRKQFNIAPTGRISDQISVVQWVETFMDTGNMWKRN